MTELRTKMRNSLVAATLGAGLVFASPASAQRQDEVDSINARLDWIEQSLLEMQSTTDGYGASVEPAATASVQDNDPALARVLTRLDALESQIRSLTDQLEQATFRIEQTNRELQSLSKDADFRLQSLEQGGGGTQPMAQSAPSPKSPDEQVLGTIPVDAVPGSYKEDYDSALGHLRKGEHENAEKALRMFLDNHSDSELAGNAQYWLGESYYVREMWRPAAQSFLICVQKYQSGTKAPDCMLKLGMSLAAMGETDKACKTLSEITRRFPDASQTIQQRARAERQKNRCT